MLVSPLASGSAFVGTPPAAGHEALDVRLEAAYLRPIGGYAYRVGELWGVQLQLMVLKSDLTLAARNLTGVANIKLTAWRGATQIVVLTRTQDADLAGASGKKELAVIGVTTGIIEVWCGETETPNAGVALWRMTGQWSSTPEVLCAGRLQIDSAKPEAS